MTIRFKDARLPEDARLAFRTGAARVISAIAMLAVATISHPALGQVNPTPTITCELSSNAAIPGTSVTLDVFLENATNVRGYQVEIEITRTFGPGEVTVPCPGGVTVDENRPDFIFLGLDTNLTPNCTDCGVIVPHCEGMRVAAARVTGGVNVGTTRAYLASFTLNISADVTASSSFVISIRPAPDSLIGGSNNNSIPFTPGPPCVLGGVIPTVSHWGLVILTLLLLVAGKIRYGARTRLGTAGRRVSFALAGALVLIGAQDVVAGGTCNDNSACNDGDVCTFDQCTGGSCGNTNTLHGDVAWAGGCGPDGVVDMLDVAAISNGFHDSFLPGCTVQNLDIMGADNSCAPDGVVDLFDIFAVLSAFAQRSKCPCQGPVCTVEITIGCSNAQVAALDGAFVQKNIAAVVPGPSGNFGQLKFLMRPFTITAAPNGGTATLSATPANVVEIFQPDGTPVALPATINTLPVTWLISGKDFGVATLRVEYETETLGCVDEVKVRVNCFPGLATETLTAFPHAEYIRTLNKDAVLNTSLDPVRHIERVGMKYAVYVVQHKTAAQYAADNSLTDVTGAIEVFPVAAGGINPENFRSAWDPANQTGPYDIVLDFGNCPKAPNDFKKDGKLDPGDIIGLLTTQLSVAELNVLRDPGAGPDPAPPMPPQRSIYDHGMITILAGFDGVLQAFTDVRLTGRFVRPDPLMPTTPLVAIAHGRHNAWPLPQAGPVTIPAGRDGTTTVPKVAADAVPETWTLTRNANGPNGRWNISGSVSLAQGESADLAGGSWSVSSTNGFIKLSITEGATMPFMVGDMITFGVTSTTGDPTAPNFDGYEYLQRHLATHGIASISVDLDRFASLSSGGIRHRGWALLKNIEAVLGANADLDRNNIVLMGHSRGGEAVLQAYRMLRDAGEQYPGGLLNVAAGGIKGIVSISPTVFHDATTNYDGTRKSAEDLNVPFLLIYGGADGDVNGINRGVRPFETYDRARAAKQVIFIEGANHNFFNTSWACDDAHQEIFTSIAPAGCKTVNPAGIGDNLVAAADARSALKAYATAFVFKHAQNKAGYDDYFKRYQNRFRPPSVPAMEILGQYMDSPLRSTMPMLPARRDGTTTAVTVVAAAGGEDWTLTLKANGRWGIAGSVSGAQGESAARAGGMWAVASTNGFISLTITEGATMPFMVGDRITFTVVAPNFVIDDYESQPATTTSSSGNPVAATVTINPFNGVNEPLLRDPDPFFDYIGPAQFSDAVGAPGALIGGVRLADLVWFYSSDFRGTLQGARNGSARFQVRYTPLQAQAQTWTCTLNGGGTWDVVGSALVAAEGPSGALVAGKWSHTTTSGQMRFTITQGAGGGAFVAGDAITFTYRGVNLDEGQPVNRFTQETQGVIVSWPAAQQRYEYELPAAERDLSNKNYISMRVAKTVPAPSARGPAIEFTVTLVDANGKNSSVRTNTFSTIPGGYVSNLGRDYWQDVFMQTYLLDPVNGNHVVYDIDRFTTTAVFRTFRFDICAFTNAGKDLDIRKVRFVRMEFGGATGTDNGNMAVDDAEVTRP